jgi:hypothetical protein
MKMFFSAMAMTLAVAFAGAAFAQDAAPTNATDCAKMGGKWDAANKKCN